jgi:adenosylhomocysteine nucleosidase
MSKCVESVRQDAAVRKEDLLSPAKIAIVAALEREVWPLVKDWPRRETHFAGRSYKFFEQEDAAVVCGGIGPEAARRATEAIIEVYRPSLVISAGFAGGLDPALATGDALRPRHILNGGDGSRTDSGIGEGVLISFPHVASREQKVKLWQAYGALAVDMEASAVAQSAQAHGVKFMACKVIFDASGSSLAPFEFFVGQDGKFYVLRFLRYVAVRPWLWWKVPRWAREAARAASNLCAALAEMRSEKLQGSEFQTIPI